MIEIEEVILDPVNAFRSPDQILRSRNLTREQKMDLLCLWEFEARQLTKTKGENGGMNNSSVLSKILKAIDKLDRN